MNKRKTRLLAFVAVGCSVLLYSCKKDQTESNPTVASEIESQSATSALAATIPTKAEALLAMQVYNNHFYNQYGTYGSSFKAYYWKDDNHSGRMDFWTQQEAIETLIDAYTSIRA
jgi:hypothetical protein